MTNSSTISLGACHIHPTIDNSNLISLGAVEIDAQSLRSTNGRWLPWLDQYEGGLVDRFLFDGIEVRGDQHVLHTRAAWSWDYPFRERRDASGDPCFNDRGWDAPPQESLFDFVFEPAETQIDGRRFTGFRYWFEYEGAPIHRLIDRQTWELGGSLSGLNLVCRNWLTPPRMALSREASYSTVGLDKWANLLPGNLWGRWSLLPSFDMQYGASGILIAHFDEVSLIRTVIETTAGEDQLRVVDMHVFEQSGKVRTNPKTVLYCADVLSDLDAMNLWTRIHDDERDRARAQFNIPQESPPAVIFSENQWRNFHFSSSYENVIDTASEFGADYVFIDPIWEHEQAYAETVETLTSSSTDPLLTKKRPLNMCCTLDWRVADAMGGESELRALCERASLKGIGMLSWIGAHMSPLINLQRDGGNSALGAGDAGVFAARESGRHPDTGYAADCWPINLNAPIGDWWRDQLLDVCERTGLSGFLWDSFCNMGWWQVDYSQGTMRPQYDKMSDVYAALCRAGLYVMPEAIVGFSSHSCCGLHGGNVYSGDLLGYSYDTNISLWQGDDDTHDGDMELKILRGQAPTDELFRCYAHRRVPTLSLHKVPVAERDPSSVVKLKEIIQAYKTVRASMVRRTVLPEDRGVLWQGSGREAILWSFRRQVWPSSAKEVLSGDVTSVLEPEAVYWVEDIRDRTK